MPYKDRKKYIYKIPTFLLIAMTALFCIGLGLSILNLYYPSPIFDAANKGFTEGYKSVMNIVIGALIASIIGLFSSLAILELKEEKERDNLILSLYYEIRDLNGKIQNIPSDNLEKCATWLTVEKNPIYPTSGLFYVFRKELSLLDPQFLEKILSIYNKILFLEQQWKNLHLTPQTFDIHTPTILTQLKAEMNDFLPIIEKEKNNIL